MNPLHRLLDARYLSPANDTAQSFTAYQNGPEFEGRDTYCLSIEETAIHTIDTPPIQDKMSAPARNPAEQRAVVGSGPATTTAPAPQQSTQNLNQIVSIYKYIDAMSLHLKCEVAPVLNPGALFCLPFVCDFAMCVRRSYCFSSAWTWCHPTPILNTLSPTCEVRAYLTLIAVGTHVGLAENLGTDWSTLPWANW